MAITSAYNNALSGLTAARRASTLVSENIANALTPGFARRSIELGTNSSTGGVRVLGITRHGDLAILANRRTADAEYVGANTLASFFGTMQNLVGTATDTDGIVARLADLESSLVSAASLPSSQQRLDQVVTDAASLASAISDASEGLRSLRTQAERNITQQVERVNVLLTDIQDLNLDITAIESSGGNPNALLDQRQLLIDEVNEIIPVNVLRRDYNQVALYSQGGAILLDGTAATLSFEGVRDTVPQMTLENGLLSGLEINGMAIATGGERNALAGGMLEANFKIRDELAVSAQADLDAVARDLIERFQNPAVDGTLAAGEAGLFTDDGAALNVAQEVGLAGRLRLNSLVDPAEGGESWRLRDGLGATAEGNSGDSRLLLALGDALMRDRTLASGDFSGGNMSASDVVSALISRAGQNAANSDQVLSFAAATQTEMKGIELEQGVDTDAELQTLIVVEQSYAANARVLEAIETMMDAILRL